MRQPENGRTDALDCYLIKKISIKYLAYINKIPNFAPQEPAKPLHNA